MVFKVRLTSLGALHLIWATFHRICPSKSPYVMWSAPSEVTIFECGFEFIQFWTIARCISTFSPPARGTWFFACCVASINGLWSECAPSVYEILSCPQTCNFCQIISVAIELLFIADFRHLSYRCSVAFFLLFLVPFNRVYMPLQTCGPLSMSRHCGILASPSVSANLEQAVSASHRNIRWTCLNVLISICLGRQAHQHSPSDDQKAKRHPRKKSCKAN